MKIKISIIDHLDNTLGSTIIETTNYYKTKIEHGKGLLDDVHKELCKNLPNGYAGFMVFYFEQNTSVNEGDIPSMSLTLRSKTIPLSLADEFIEIFGTRITNYNQYDHGLTEEEINNFLNERTNVGI